MEKHSQRRFVVMSNFFFLFFFSIRLCKFIYFCVVHQCDTLKMHYTGVLEDGTQFDSSIPKGRPFQFVIGEFRNANQIRLIFQFIFLCFTNSPGIEQVIKGWDEGVMKMSLGEQAQLVISPDYGYGETGVPGGLELLLNIFPAIALSSLLSSPLLSNGHVTSHFIRRFTF
jgi:hypothetical protein